MTLQFLELPSDVGHSVQVPPEQPILFGQQLQPLLQVGRVQVGGLAHGQPLLVLHLAQEELAVVILLENAFQFGGECFGEDELVLGQGEGGPASGLYLVDHLAGRPEETVDQETVLVIETQLLGLEFVHESGHALEEGAVVGGEQGQSLTLCLPVYSPQEAVSLDLLQQRQEPQVVHLLVFQRVESVQAPHHC